MKIASQLSPAPKPVGIQRTLSRSQVLHCIAKQYGPSLQVYFFHKLRGHHQDAEEMLQELYSRLWCYDRLYEVQCIKGFLFTIAANLVRDKARRAYSRAAKVSSSIDDIELSVEDNNPEAVVESWQSLEQLDATLNELPPKCKKAFLLHRLDGFSHKEIALHMGVTTSMIEKHICRAIKVTEPLTTA